ncbi:MAG: AAA family ATPase [Solirubrobacterales bacterium]
MTGTAGRTRKPPRRQQRSWLGIVTVVLLVMLLGGFLGVLEYSRPHVSGETLTFSQFVESANAGQIQDAVLLDEDAYVVGDYVRDDGAAGVYNTPLVRHTQGDLLDLLLSNRIPTEIDQQVGKRVAQLGAILLPGLILVVLFVYLILSWRRGTGLFGVKSGARKITAEDSPVRFADVAGQDAAVAELAEIRSFLASPERFAELGAAVPKGVLLYGPPGCGKTLLAKALAGEAGASFYSISGSDFVELYVGVGAARVRDLFAEARANAPALVFIDELDSVGRARTAGGTTQVASHSEQEQALNQILAEMDGFSPAQGLLVLGATNRPDILDPALLRPGRFDRTVGLERPDEAARLAILSLHAQGKRLAGDADLAVVANRAIGMTGADLASVLNEAALLAARAGKPEIGQGELDTAVGRILDAPERQRRLSLRDRGIGRRHTGADRVGFADLAGVDDAVAELTEVRDYLADPDRFAALGARPPRGILLSGPPGCGKTLLARAVAGEANAAFFSVAASEFVEVYVGQGAARVRDLFAEARAVAPAIVFLDEVDAIGAHRGTSAGGGAGEREQTLNQILTELDGFDAATAVTVMAATNRPDLLDAALTRPGRFDRHVAVALPDRAGRRAILALHAAGKPLATDVDVDAVAGLTRGFSGADLANVLNEAALLAARAGLGVIGMDLVEEGIDRARLGVASRGVILSEEERRIVAYHEAGHALVSWALPAAEPPHKLSIVARGGALGHCTTVDAHDRVLVPRSLLIDRMAVGLGGLVAEEVVFGEPTTGSASDLDMASSIARRMVCELGMSTTVGRVTYPRQAATEAAGQAIDAEVRRLVDTEAYGRAHAILTGSRAALDRIALALLERETLTGDQLSALAAGEALPPHTTAGDGNAAGAGGPASKAPAASGEAPAAPRPQPTGSVHR